MKDQEYFDIVANELARDERNAGLWARALVEAGGVPEKTIAAYIKLRVEQLRSERGTSKIDKAKKEIKNNFIEVTNKSIGPFRLLAKGIAILAMGWAIFVLIMGIFSGHIDYAIIHVIIAAVIGFPAFLVGKQRNYSE